LGEDSAGWGIYVDDNGTVTCIDCCYIHDNFGGIGINDAGNLTANGNSIAGNFFWGVAWYPMLYEEEPSIPVRTFDCEDNWWGDITGPLAPDHPEGLGNPVTNGIDYNPWLDGPCPRGQEAGMNANLKGVARTGEPGLKVIFTDLSTPAPGCEITEWLWDFGDGSTSTEQNPTHIYAREGDYTVTLTVWDSCDHSATITYKAYIRIAKPKAGEVLEPANLGVSYLNIDPAQVLPNQEVTVSANICNNGEERGTRTVSLMINGVAEQSQSESAAAPASRSSSRSPVPFPAPTKWPSKA
jgi:hypothetical protein